MKKVLCLLMVLTMAVGCISISASAAEYGTVLNNNVAMLVGSTRAIARNTLVNLSAAPVVQDDAVFIPVDALATLFNGTVVQDAAGFVDIRFGVDKLLVLRAGSINYTYNNRGYSFTVAPREVNGVLMVPLSDVLGTVVGKIVFYDPTTQLIVVSDRIVLTNYANDGAVISSIANAISSGFLPPISVPTTYDVDWNSADAETLDEILNAAIDASRNRYDTGSSSSGPAGVTEIPSSPLSKNGWTVECSREDEAENPASRLIDGDDSDGNFWASSNEGGMRVATIDMGSVQTVIKVEVAVRAYTDGRIVHYGIAYSEDGSSFVDITDANTYEASAGGGMYESFNINAQARYIRVTTNGSSTNQWVSLRELTAYGPYTGSSGSGSSSETVSVGPEIPAASMLYTASAQPQAENPASSAFDNNPSTFWAVEGANSMTVDLGEEKEISAVGVQMRNYTADNPNRTLPYTVSVSTDGSNYATVASKTSPPGGGVLETVAVNQPARYVKIDVNGSNEGQWSSVAEIKVYGEFVPASYRNLSSIPGEFMLAVAGSTDVVSADENKVMSLGAPGANSKWSYNGSGIINTANGLALDVYNQSLEPGTQVGVWESSGDANQQWTLELDGNGYYIRNAMSGLYLAVSGGNFQQNVKDSATKWAVTDGSMASNDDDGSVAVGGESTVTSFDINTVSGEFVLAEAGTAFVLVANEDGEITLVPYTGDANQSWKADNSSVVNASTGGRMDVYQASARVGMLVYAESNISRLSQKWDFELENGTYCIKNRESGLYLSVIDGLAHQRGRHYATRFDLYPSDSVNITPGTVGYVNLDTVPGNFMLAVPGGTDVLSVGDDNFTLSVGSDTGRALWSVENAGIKNEASGLFMDVSEQSMDEGGSIIVWEGNGGTNQQWTLEPDAGGYYIRSDMSGLYLTVVGSELQQRSKAYATRWIVTDGTLGAIEGTVVTPDIPEVNNSSYTNLDAVPGEFILVRFNSDDVLTVGDDNSTLSVGAYTQSNKQQWTIDGTSIKSVGVGNVMDVSGQSKDAGGTICVWEVNGGDNQVWAFEREGGGYYIKSIWSGLYLSVVGNAVQQVPRSEANKWMIANK